jgi:hypothetical protein
MPSLLRDTLGEKRDHRPLHYHTPNRASSWIRFSGGTGEWAEVLARVLAEFLGQGCRLQPLGSPSGTFRFMPAHSSYRQTHTSSFSRRRPSLTSVGFRGGRREGKVRKIDRFRAQPAGPRVRIHLAPPFSPAVFGQSYVVPLIVVEHAPGGSEYSVYSSVCLLGASASGPSQRTRFRSSKFHRNTGLPFQHQVENSSL